MQDKKNIKFSGPARNWQLCLHHKRVREPLVIAFQSIQSLEQWFDASVIVIKDDPYSRVGFVELDGLGRVYVKCYVAKSFWHSLAMKLRTGRSFHNFRISQALAEKGFSVPTPYALLRSNGNLGQPKACFYLCQALAPEQDLKSFYLEHNQPDDDLIAHYLAASGRQLAKLHNMGFAHGDFKWSNIQIVEKAVFFLDLDNAKARAHRSMQARDLARFILNSEELGLEKHIFQGFLASYHNESTQSEEKLMALVRVHLAKLRKRHRLRYGERGTPLLD